MRGLTPLELLAVAVAIGPLTSFVAPRAFGGLRKPQAGPAPAQRG